MHSESSRAGLSSIWKQYKRTKDQIDVNKLQPSKSNLEKGIPVSVFKNYKDS